MAHVYVLYKGINNFAGVFDTREAAIFATPLSEGRNDEYEGQTFAKKEHGYCIERIEVKSFQTILRDKKYAVQEVLDAMEAAGQSKFLDQP